MTFASFEGRKMLANSVFSKFVFEDEFLHISFGLPGPLWTAFELKNCTAYSKISAGCDCANGECY